MIKKLKKGFTLVELVVVIAVIAILAAVSVVSYMAITNKANESHDQQIIDQINLSLKAEVSAGRKPETMHKALQVLDADGFAPAKFGDLHGTAKDYEFAFSLKESKFLILKKGAAETQILYPSDVGAHADFEIWKFADGVSSTDLAGNYSYYLRGSDKTGTASIKAGFDVGENEGISAINYDRASESSAINVVVRTNSASTNLEVNGYVDPSDSTKGDIINHYGSAGELNIIKCAMGSYHENGRTAFAEVKKGRIVLENSSSIKHIHINAEGNSFADVVIKNNGAASLPESITRDKVDVSSATKVVIIEQGNTSETVYVYPDGTSGSTEKTTSQNQNVNSDLGQLVLDNGSNPGEKAKGSEEKAEIKEEVVEEAQNEEQVEKAEEAGYEVTHHDALAPTCTEAGHTAYDSYYVNGEEVKVGYKDIPATGHSVDMETGKCTVCGAQEYFFKVGSNLYKSNQFSEAWAAAKGGANSFKILCNMTMNAIPADGKFVIDLNGFALTLRGHSSTNGGVRVYALSDYGGDLTIKNGTLNLPGTNYSSYGIYCNGNLTLKDLTINSACSTVIYVDGQLWNTDGVATLDNVTINATNTSGTAYKSHCVKNSFTSAYHSPMTYIKNSTINSAYNGCDFQATNAEVENTSITGTNNVLWANFSATGGDATGVVTLKGTTNVTGGSDYSRIHAQSGNSFSALAGTYNFDPTSYVDSEAFDVTDNGNDTWSVVAKA